MKVYKLAILLHQPSEPTEDKFLAEVPALPGCRAWGDTAAEALECLQSVTAAFIASYQEKGDNLPPEVEAAALDNVGPEILGEMIVAV